LQDGGVWAYVCAQAHSQRAEKTCQFLIGNEVDAAVTQIFLDAMQPAQLEISMAAFEQIEGRAQQVDQQWQLRLERTRYEAELAQRRFFAIDPDNRLVARSLEHDWNDKLTQVEQLEHEYAAFPKWSDHLVSPQERQRILALAQDLPAIWQAPTTSHAERKQLLRFLIKDATLTRQDKSVQIHIRWQTEAVTSTEVARRPKSYELRRTQPAVLEHVRLLAHDHTDQQIADRLNQAGLVPGLGGSFTARKICWIRYAYQIPTNCPKAPELSPTGQRGDGRYSARMAAQLLNVTTSTIADWCVAGILDNIQDTPHGPRWISLTPERITALRKPVQRRWQKLLPA
jgi:hypothetical protein